MVEMTMDVQSWLRKQLEEASPDLSRAMVQEFAEALMGAEADALGGAPYGERAPSGSSKRRSPPGSRVNRRERDGAHESRGHRSGSHGPRASTPRGGGSRNGLVAIARFAKPPRHDASTRRGQPPHGPGPGGPAELRRRVQERLADALGRT